jgi:hypothetical protein
MLSPTSLEQVWTPFCTPDKFPSISSDLWERSRRNHNHPKTNIVVTVVGVVVVAVSTTTVVWVVVPRATAKQLKLPVPSSLPWIQFFLNTREANIRFRSFQVSPCSRWANQLLRRCDTCTRVILPSW